jgi:sugar lactone lactonase YvrE
MCVGTLVSKGAAPTVPHDHRLDTRDDRDRHGGRAAARLPTMETLHATQFVDGFRYGEGPRWHEGKLWFTDGPNDAVKTVGLDGRVELALETGHPSGLGWLPDGTLVISTLHSAQIKLARPEGVVVAHDFGDRAASTNDIVVSAEGFIYLDLYRPYVEGELPTGDILVITPDGEVKTVAQDLSTPNGIGISPDGSTLVVAETFGNRLLAYAIAPDGTLSGERVYAEFGEGHGPDGVCLDAEGAVWVGCHQSSEFLRVLDGGEITHRVPIGGDWAVAPALGGEDRRTLYMVVNRTSYEQMAAGQSEGRIEQVRVDVPGAGRP